MTPGATWQRSDDVPGVAQGLTHGSHVIVGKKIYNCGGYIGGHPGPSTATCLVYDHSKPSGQRYSTTDVPPLPALRSAGGLFYDKTMNAIFYTGGADRRVPYNIQDHNTTWMYSFNNPSNGWVRKSDVLFRTNHMVTITATDANGRERHYAVGGMGGDTSSNIFSDVAEYDATNNVWIRRNNMPFPRGHAGASTFAFGCGFIMVSGSTTSGHVKDVTYYSPSDDTWTKIGDTRDSLNSPVCDIHSSDVMYCEGGATWTARSTKRKILR